LVVADSKREADELREELARTDQQILTALDKRAHVSRRLGELQKEHAPSLPVMDHEAIRALVGRSNGNMPQDSLNGIFREIFAACLALALPVKVTYVGMEGGVAHSATLGRFDHASSLIAAESTAAALGDVSRRRVEFAVVPFESSSEGPVRSTILAVLASDLRVAEVLEVPVELHLMNRSGNLGEVQRIHVTPADRALCERFLATRTVVEAHSPRDACERAAQDGGDAAIANESFGVQLGLQVASRNVLDKATERIRYAVVGSRPSRRTGKDATSLVFGVQDAPGSLLDVLRLFAERGINLAKIQSHPVDGEAWSYLFYVEMAGHFTDRPLVMAFEEMKRITRFFRVLGSYPIP